MTDYNPGEDLSSSATTTTVMRMAARTMADAQDREYALRLAGGWYPQPLSRIRHLRLRLGCWLRDLGDFVIG